MFGRSSARLLCLVLLLSSLPALAQKKPSVAIPDFGSNGTSLELGNALGGLVANEFQKIGAFDVVTAEGVRALLSRERQRQVLGCAESESCIEEIAGALGTDYLVQGKVSKLPGPTYSLELAILDAKKAKRVSSEVRTASSEAELTSAVPKAVKALVAPLLKNLTGFVRVTSNEPQATVKVDDRIVGTTPLDGQLELPAGKHVITIEKEGFVTYEREVLVARGQTEQQEASLRPSPDYMKKYEEGAKTARLLAWIAGGVAVAAVGTAGYELVHVGQVYGTESQQGSFAYERAKLVAGIESDAEGNHRANALRLKNEVDTSQAVMVTGAAVGAAGLITAGALFLFGGDPDRYAQFRTVSVSVVPVAHGVSGAFSLSF